jgi:hypothetical protein
MVPYNRTAFDTSMPFPKDKQEDPSGQGGEAPFGLWQAVHYSVVGIVLPYFGLLVGNEGVPDWQSGDARDHALLLLTRSAMAPFWPLFAIAFAALGTFLSSIPRHRNARWVHFGLVLGILLGAQFTIIQWVAIGFFPPGIVIAASVILWGEHVVACDTPSTARRVGGTPDLTRIGSVLLCVLVAGVLLLGLMFRGGNQDSPGVLVMLQIPLVGWPTALLVTCTMARARGRISALFSEQDPVPRMSLNSFLGGFGVYIGSWYLAVSREMAAYNKLPIQPPPDDCYVANAACRGHRAWVRSEWVERQDGPPFLVNPQLRTLKAGEIAFKAILPRGHWILRCAYDAIGPRLATRIRSPWLADVAYAGLVPLALATHIMLRILGMKPRVRRW